MKRNVRGCAANGAKYGVCSSLLTKRLFFDTVRVSARSPPDADDAAIPRLCLCEEVRRLSDRRGNPHPCLCERPEGARQSFQACLCERPPRERGNLLKGLLRRPDASSQRHRADCFVARLLAKTRKEITLPKLRSEYPRIALWAKLDWNVFISALQQGSMQTEE